MPKSDPIRIRHALDAAVKATGFVGDMDFDEFREDERTVLATLHCIMVVGEALNQVSPAFRQRHAGIPWQESAGMRNRLVHAYDDVDHLVVFETVKSNLPGLIDALEAILREGA